VNASELVETAGVDPLEPPGAVAAASVVLVLGTVWLDIGAVELVVDETVVEVVVDVVELVVLDVEVVDDVEDEVVVGGRVVVVS